MGVFDQAARYAAKLDPAGLFAWLVPRFAASHHFQRFIDTSLLAFPGEPDRICDTVAELTPAGEDGQLWLLDVEFQSEPDADILERLAEYAYRLRREVRHGPGAGGKYAVASVLANLTGPPQAAELRATDEALDGAGLVHPVVLSGVAPLGGGGAGRPSAGGLRGLGPGVRRTGRPRRRLADGFGGL